MRSRKNGKDAFTALLFTDCTEITLIEHIPLKLSRFLTIRAVSLYAKINPVHKSMTHSNDVIFCHESYFSTYVVIGKGARFTSMY